MEQRESPWDVNGNVNWCRHQGKHAEFLKIRSKIKLPYDATVPLLRFYSKEKKKKTLTERDNLYPHFHCSIIHISREMKTTGGHV